MKTLTLITLALITLNLSAQSDSVIVHNTTHEMTGKILTKVSEPFIASTDGERGVSLTMFFENNQLTGLTAYTYLMGVRCNENNIMIFKFSDGSKITLKSWNDFSCKNSYFDTTQELITKFKTLELDKVYFMNGDSGIDGTFTISQKRYFIQIMKGTKAL